MTKKEGDHLSRSGGKGRGLRAMGHIPQRDKDAITKRVEAWRKAVLKDRLRP